MSEIFRAYAEVTGCDEPDDESYVQEDETSVKKDVKRKKKVAKETDTESDTSDANPDSGSDDDSSTEDGNDGAKATPAPSVKKAAPADEMTQRDMDALEHLERLNAPAGINVDADILYMLREKKASHDAKYNK